MASVCVGCGLKVVGGLLEADLPVVAGHVEQSVTIRRDSLELALIAPFPSNGAPYDAYGVVAEQLKVLTLTNPHTCRAMTFMVNAHGRARMDVNTSDNIFVTDANELRNEIRWNGGPWWSTDHVAYAQDGTANGRKTQNWVGHRMVPPIVVPAGGKLEFDRRGLFRWEVNRITNLAFWNLPSITAFGI